MRRDGLNASIWQATEPTHIAVHIPDAEQLYDAIVVGAGITGVTTALELQKAGKNVLLLEARNLGFGTTGGTTAHLNNFFDASYDEVIKDFGLENAKLLAKAGTEVIETIRQNVREYQLECAFSERTAYLFSLDEKQTKTLDNVVTGTQKAGIEIDYINDSPFPIPYLKLAQIPGQAQFNPLLYIEGLLEVFLDAGGTYMENCRVQSAEEDEIIKVTSSQGAFQCRNLIYATHIPPGVNILHFRNAPYRSYAIAVTLKDDKYPQALGYDLEDPYHYYRSQEINGQEYLIAGGNDHKTGHEENTEQCLRELEAYVRKYFDIEAVAYRWSSQYFVPTDGLPYIGHLPGSRSNVFTATGFNGNGMILGTLSAKILADLIILGDSEYNKLFSPSRVKPIAGFQDFIKESADVVYKFVADKIGIEKIRAFSEIAKDEAKVVSFEGHTLAIYKDEQNVVHAVNAACSHIKCTVAWNNSEKTWDCPCHGSRFSMDGEMLTAPGRKDLEKFNLQ